LELKSPSNTPPADLDFWFQIPDSLK